MQTPDPRPHSYDAATRQQAVRLYVDSMNRRRVGRAVGVTHPTVANWVNALAAQLPDRLPQPSVAVVNELDELFTFIVSKKAKSTL